MTLLRRVLPGLAVLLLQASVARAAGPVEMEVWIGERARLRLGLVQQVLSLDPELVEVATVEADLLEVLGRQYGVATVRVWTADGALVVRVRVRGLRPTAPAGPGNDRGDLGLEASIRQYAYRSPTGTDSVTALSLAGRLPVGRNRGRVEAWLEERSGGFLVPHYLLEVTRAGGDPGSGMRATAGNLTLDWGRFTFARDRVEAGLFEVDLAPRDGRPRLGLALLAGRDAPDGVALGSRFRSTFQAAGERYGGRIWWEPADGLTLVGEAVAHEVRPGTLDVVGSGGFDLVADRVRARGRLGHDGVHWAGNGSLDVAVGQSVLHLDGEATEHGFRTPIGSLVGVSSLSGTFTQRLGARLRLEVAASFRELDRGAFASPGGTSCPESGCEPARWTRGSSRRVGAWWKASEVFAVRADLEAREQGLGDRRWSGSRGGVEVGFDLGRGVGAAGRLRLESTSEHAEGKVAGDWSWSAARLDARLSALAWLAVDGSVERRFAVSVAGNGPQPWLWSAGLRGRLPASGPLESLAISAALRNWEHLGTVDGRFVRGRYLSGSLDLATRPWRGLRLELRGGWSRDLESGDGSAALEVGLALGLGRAERTDRSEGGRRTVRGLVFADADGDGVADRAEAGIAGVLVRLSDGREARTGPAGRFRFRRVEAGASVRLVAESVPAGLALTGPSVRSVALARTHGSDLAFGLGPGPGRLEVVAFQDLDGDRVRDPDEPLLPGVTVVLDGGRTLRTLATGPVVHQVPPRATVAGRLLDATFPDGYRCTSGALLPPMSVNPDATAVWEIAFAAWRTVRGVVFLDDDGDGAHDPGETAGAGLVVTAAARAAVTDGMGRFVLAALPAGPVRIEAHPPSLPPGWVPTGPVEVQLGPQPRSVEGLEVRLVRAGR